MDGKSPLFSVGIKWGQTDIGLKAILPYGLIDSPVACGVKMGTDGHGIKIGIDGWTDMGLKLG